MEDALHKCVGRFLYIAFVECCQNMVYHLDKCGVYEGLWEESNMDEKDQKKTDKKEKCFVIMPISDPEGYEKGHFQYVYEDLLIPAIEEAGFEPKRADDDKSSSMIQINIIRDIIEAPMAICDLSSRNPNVLFELGIRQAFDLPVVLIQEEGTQRIFDINTINTIDYRSDLIYREVMEDRSKISEAIKSTQDNTKGINSIIRLLDLGPAKLGEKKKTSELDDIKLLLLGLSNQINEIKKNDGVKVSDTTVDSLSNATSYSSYTHTFARFRRRLNEENERSKIFDLLNKIHFELNTIMNDNNLSTLRKEKLQERYEELIQIAQNKIVNDES